MPLFSPKYWTELQIFVSTSEWRLCDNFTSKNIAKDQKMFITSAEMDLMKVDSTTTFACKALCFWLLDFLLFLEAPGQK